MVSIQGNDNVKETLYNQIKKPQMEGDKLGISLTLDVKQWEVITGGSSETKPSLREVHNNTHCNVTETCTDDETHPVYVMTDGNPKTNPETVLMREKDPQNPECINKILQEVMIGPDITQEQHQIVQELLKEHADCFTLSIKEVNAILGTVHKLNILEGATFQTKIPPRSYNPDQ